MWILLVFDGSMTDRRTDQSIDRPTDISSHLKTKHDLTYYKLLHERNILDDLYIAAGVAIAVDKQIAIASSEPVLRQSMRLRRKHRITS